MNSAIVFDLDGTLYQSKELDRENFNAAVSAIQEWKQISAVEAKELLEDSRSTLLGKTSISIAIKKIGVSDDIFKKYQLKNMRPLEHIKQDMEMVELVRKLKKLFKVVLLTNSRREIALEVLHILGFSDDDFDNIISGGDGFSPKPNMDTLMYALSSVDGDPLLSYTVGDRWEVDHRLGVSIGIRPISISSRGDLIKWMKFMAEKIQDIDG